MNDGCQHTVTRGRVNESGSWCVDCGVKVFEVETRPCGQCKHFFTHPTASRVAKFEGCKKLLMRVTKDMKVTYKISAGTCFE